MKEEILLNYISNYLKQGFAINDILHLLSLIHNTKQIAVMKKCLEIGNSFEQAILTCDFDPMFKEYFSFYLHNGSIADAIDHSLDICKMKRNIINRIKKELSYPVFLLLFLMLFSIFLVYGLLPQVNNLFQEFELERSLIQKSFFLLFQIVPLLLLFTIFIILAMIIFFIYSIKTQNFHYIDFIIDRIVGIRVYLQYYYSLKFAIYYDELMKCGYDTFSIIEILNQQIQDSDIKMIVYEIQSEIQKGKEIGDIINEFPYFDRYFKEHYKLLLLDTSSDKNLHNYIESTMDHIHHTISKVVHIITPFVYGFVTTFVIAVYLSIIIPMMNIVELL